MVKSVTLNVNLKREEKHLEDQKQLVFKISEWIGNQEQKLQKEYQKIEKYDWIPDYDKKLNKFIEKARQLQLRVDWENKQLEKLKYKVAEFETIKEHLKRKRSKNKCKKSKEKIDA